MELDEFRKMKENVEGAYGGKLDPGATDLRHP
jgi:hypothetical protein